MRPKFPVPALAVALSAGATSCALAQNTTPDAAMLMYPDVSKTHIAFVYQNDIWTVSRDGGEARPLAAPPGREGFPRFSPDGSKIAFVGNYEGGRDLYVIPTTGGLAERVTHHPTGEVLCDWTPDGDLLYYANGMAGLRRQTQLFTVDQSGGLPEKLPVPYGAAGAISPDGSWLAYTPYNRDFRTWKRYRGGLASDIWLFNLETNESRRATDWEGTDTQPMWHANTLYFLSDAGPEHRLNLWKYEMGSGAKTQITNFTDYDVKWPSMGPGADGRGEIVFQAGPELYLLSLASSRERAKAIRISVPGDREGVRPHDVDFSEFISDGAVSPTAKRFAIEARGDIWSLPAEKGISRNLTGTSGSAERDPVWSPDGKWIAYLSDKSGEYEVYVTQSDGKGETRQLTDDGEMFRYLGAWSPDSETLVNYDKSGRLLLLDIESGENTLVTTDRYAERPPVSWSHDSRWITFAESQENQQRAVVLYDTDSGEKHTVTDPFFDASHPTFDRKGSFLYYVSTEQFAPSYSEVDTTFVYDDTQKILAVALRNDVEDPFLPEVDVEEWDDDDADADEDEGDDAEADDDDAADEDQHPLHGVWRGTATGPENMIPGGKMDIAMTFIVDEDGGIAGSSEAMGETSPYDSIEFDEGSGRFTASRTENGVTSVVEGTLDGDVIEGTWEIDALGISGTFRIERTDEEPDADAVESDEAVEVVEIDLDGFQRRAIALPIEAGRFWNLAVNDGNKLFYMRAATPMPAIKMFDIDDHEEGERQVLGGAMQFEMSADGKSLGVRGPNGVAAVKASPGQSFGKMVPTDAMTYRVNPKEEWAQMLRDAWRIHRDFFYEPTMHGVDWPAVYDRYAAMLTDASSREDLSYLIGEMIAELNVGHAYYWGGDVEDQPSRNVGLLGADFELASEGGESAYRFATIHEGAAWDSDARNPLRAPGVNVEEGDYLLAVNGTPVPTDRNPWAAFQGLAGKVTELTVSKKPFMDDEARDVLVTPMGNDQNLRYRAWIEDNRQHVDYRTGGRVGYIYVPNTGVDGQNDLFRQFYGQRDKDALIIDERWNGGGQIPTRFIELLNRPRTNYWRVRDGTDWAWPPDSHQGPKVMLINGAAGSGGDMFPALFRQSGLGKLIGTRTWGGLVGISGNPGLIDGGYTAVPTFGYYEPDGTWGIEGHGVDPDIEVIDDPALMVDGGDPQLDTAIDVILEEVRRNPYTPPTRPKSPNRSGMGIEDSDR